MSDIVLQGRGICTSFGSKRERRQVLFDVDVDVYEGECLAIIGASGSGKSTLTRVLFGLGSADSGEITYRGQTMGKRALPCAACYADRPAWCSRTPSPRSTRAGASHVP